MRDERFVKSHMMVLQEVAIIPIFAGTTKLKNDMAPNQEKEGHQSPPVRPYQPPVPYPKRLAQSKLESRMV